MKKINMIIVVIGFVLLTSLAVFIIDKKENKQKTEQVSHTSAINTENTSPSATTEPQNNRPASTTQDSNSVSNSESQTTSITTISPTPTSTPFDAVQTCMLDQWHNVFFGTIGTEEICMDIYQDGTDITAFYVYKNSVNEMKLVGNLDGFHISLGDDSYNSLTGTLTSADEPGGRLDGTFILSNGNKLPVLLEMSYACGAAIDNFYEIMGSSNQEVEDFLTELKNYILSSNKEAVAQLIKYPVNVSIVGKSTTISSSQEFIDQYNEIMSKDLVNSISNAYTKFLFNNYQGVMFGGNQFNIWIQKAENKLTIMGINY